MKQCPNCRKIYPDDLFFCLDDGTPLTIIRNAVDPNAPTEAVIDLGQARPTEVLRVTPPSDPTRSIPNVEPVVSKPASKWPYFVIGILALACIGLASAMVIINRDRLFPPAGANTRSEDPTKTPPPSPVTPTPRTANTEKNTNQPVTGAAVYPSPAGKWKGEWSTPSGTLLDFDITIEDSDNTAIQGNIYWTLRRSARPDKADKIGLSATEYVRGTYDTATGTLNLKGYDKDDPNGMLVMLDVYKLNITAGGHTLTGRARNGGKWNGNIKLTRY